MEATAIAKRDPSQIANPTSLPDMQRLGDIFVKSGFFSDTRDAAQAIVKVMAGHELGFPPIASMTGVYIVKGKVSLSANLIAAAIKRSGKYNFRVRHLDNDACEIEFMEMVAGKWESIGLSSLSMTEAMAANLHKDWSKDKQQWVDKPTWKNFPRNMLYARTMSNGAKWFCPDIFGGPVYTPEELGATVDGETGEVIDVPAQKPALIASESRQSAPEPAAQGKPAPAPKSAAQIEFEAIAARLKTFQGITREMILDRIAELCDGERNYGNLTEALFAAMIPDFERWENELHAAQTESAAA